MPDEAIAYVVGNDADMATSFALLLNSVNIKAELMNDPVEFIRSFSWHHPSCIIMEMRMPRLTGLELLTQLKQRRLTVPAIVVTYYGEVTSAVRAMKLGAVDFFEKPVNEELLLECVQNWLIVNRHEFIHEQKMSSIEEKLARLSPREIEVLIGIIGGKLNKEIANDLDITPKAVELYRSNLMKKMEVRTLAALIRETLFTAIGRAHRSGSAGVGESPHTHPFFKEPPNVEKAFSELAISLPFLRKSCRH